jgi:hypothetical protein
VKHGWQAIALPWPSGSLAVLLRAWLGSTLLLAGVFRIGEAVDTRVGPAVVTGFPTGSHPFYRVRLCSGAVASLKPDSLMPAGISSVLRATRSANTPSPGSAVFPGSTLSDSRSSTSRDSTPGPFGTSLPAPLSFSSVPYPRRPKRSADDAACDDTPVHMAPTPLASGLSWGSSWRPGHHDEDDDDLAM